MDTRRPEATLNLVMLGTKEHRDNVKTILTQLADAIDQNQQYLHLIDGLGATSNNRQTEHPMVGQYNPEVSYDAESDRLNIKKHPRPLTQAVSKLNGLAYGTGYKDAMNEALMVVRALIHAGKKPLRINMFGFSRGADTLLRVCNLLAEEFTPEEIEINFFSIDDVPGPGRNNARKACVVPAIVTNYFSILMRDEKRGSKQRGIFEVQDKRKLSFQSAATKARFFIFYGDHSHATRLLVNPFLPSTNKAHKSTDAARLLWAVLQDFIKLNDVNTQISDTIPYLNYTIKENNTYQVLDTPTSTKLSEQEKLAAYSRMARKAHYYVNDGGWLNWVQAYTRTLVNVKHEYFLHGNQMFVDANHMKLFRDCYPSYFDYYFQNNRAKATREDINKDIAEIKQQPEVEKLLNKHGYKTRRHWLDRKEGLNFTLPEYEQILEPYWNGLQAALRSVFMGKDNSIKPAEAENILREAYKILTVHGGTIASREAALRAIIDNLVTELRTRQQTGILYYQLRILSKNTDWAKTILEELTDISNQWARRPESNTLDNTASGRYNQAIITTITKIQNLAHNLNEETYFQARKAIRHLKIETEQLGSPSDPVNPETAIAANETSLASTKQDYLKQLSALDALIPDSLFEIIRSELKTYLDHIDQRDQTEAIQAADHQEESVMRALKMVLDNILELGGENGIHLIPTIRLRFRHVVKQLQLVHPEIKRIDKLLTDFATQISVATSVTINEESQQAVRNYEASMQSLLQNSMAPANVIAKIQQYLDSNMQFEASCHEYQLAQLLLAAITNYKTKEITLTVEQVKALLKQATDEVDRLEVNNGLKPILVEISKGLNNIKPKTLEATLEEQADAIYTDFFAKASVLTPQTNLALRYSIILEELMLANFEAIHEALQRKQKLSKQLKDQIRPYEQTLCQMLISFLRDLDLVSEGQNYEVIKQAIETVKAKVLASSGQTILYRSLDSLTQQLATIPANITENSSPNQATQNKLSLFKHKVTTLFPSRWQLPLFILGAVFLGLLALGIAIATGGVGLAPIGAVILGFVGFSATAATATAGTGFAVLVAATVLMSAGVGAVCKKLVDGVKSVWHKVSNYFKPKQSNVDASVQAPQLPNEIKPDVKVAAVQPDGPAVLNGRGATKALIAELNPTLSPITTHRKASPNTSPSIAKKEQASEPDTSLNTHKKEKEKKPRGGRDRNQRQLFFSP